MYEKIQAKNYTAGRLRTVRLIVLHTMETKVPGAARAVARWFAGPSAPQASAHFCVDDKEIIQCVDTKDTAWAAPGANADGIQIEMAGYARQTPAEWEQEPHISVLRNAARLVRELCDQHNIPTRMLTTLASKDDVLAGAAGITTHRVVSLAYKKSTHTDPGLGFPHELFLQMVNAAREEPVIRDAGEREVEAASDGGVVVTLHPFDPLEFVPICDGVMISKDAVKIDGVRVVADPIEATRIVSAFGGYLPTPLLLDMAYEQATKIAPVTMAGCPTTKQAAKRNSEDIDKLVASAGAGHKLVAPTGKQWVAPREDRPHTRAGEYGWHVGPWKLDVSNWRGIPLHASANGALAVIQPEWYGHGLTQNDYSRKVRVVLATAEALGIHYAGRRVEGYSW